MTKQYVYNVNKNTIECDGKFVAYVNSVDGFRIANKFNVFEKENEKLKQENQKLMDYGRELLEYINSPPKHRKSIFDAVVCFKDKNGDVE